MSDQIQRLREVAEAATEGPWEASSDYVETVPELDLHRFGAMGLTIARVDQTDADAEHIATFDPPTVLDLLDRLERAEAAVERVRNSVGAVMAVRASGRYDNPTTLGWLDAFVGDITDALDGGER